MIKNVAKKTMKINCIANYTKKKIDVQSKGEEPQKYSNQNAFSSQIFNRCKLIFHDGFGSENPVMPGRLTSELRFRDDCF